MKKIVIIILTCSLIISACNGQIVKRTAAPMYTDSFINVEQDKIIGDLKFGMTKDIALAEIQKYKTTHTSGEKYSIGNFVFQDIFEMYDPADANKIAYVVIGSSAYADSDKSIENFISKKGVGRNNSNTIFFQQLKELIKVIEQQYGKGNDDTTRSVLDINLADGDENHLLDVMKWVVGKKTIQINVMRNLILENAVNEAQQHSIDLTKIGKNEHEQKYLDKINIFYKRYSILLCIYPPALFTNASQQQRK